MRARNFNIDSLAVSHTDREDASRMTITLHGDDVAVEQAAKQLYRLIDVLKVQDVTSDPTVEHELALVKVRATDSNRDEILRLVELSRGRVVDLADGSVIVEVTGTESEIDDVRVARADLWHQGVGPHRRRRDGEGRGVHRGGDQAMTARMYYDDDADPAALGGADGRDHRLWQPGPCPCAEPARERGRRRRRAGAGLEEPAARRGGRAAGRRRRRRGPRRPTSS